MKLLGKNRGGARDGAQDREVDSLLRAYVSRPRNRECSEFDADLANAYIERSLNTASRSRYEHHLSECTPCRKNVTALSRLTEPELRPSISARAASRPGERRIFGATSWPRWAMAAAAVIVLAISLPLLLTRSADRVSQKASQAVAETAATDNTQAIDRSSPSPATKQPAASASSSEAGRRSEKRQTDTTLPNGPAPAQQPAGVAGDRAASNGKLEAKAEPKAADQVQVTAGGQQVSDGAAGQAQQAKRSDKEDASRARQQQPSKDAEAADTKSSGNEQDQQNAKEKTLVAESAATPPPPAAPAAKAGKLKRSSARLSLRDGSAPEAVRPTEKRVGGKTFLLKNDTWTDKNFDSDKDLPVVTIIHSSNVYNELLSKQAGLKTFLAGFNPTERAIIVYKGTVYKLIPQQSNQ
jgi:hypothetical protein